MRWEERGRKLGGDDEWEAREGGMRCPKLALLGRCRPMGPSKKRFSHALLVGIWRFRAKCPQPRRARDRANERGSAGKLSWYEDARVEDREDTLVRNDERVSNGGTRGRSSQGVRLGILLHSNSASLDIHVDLKTFREGQKK